MEIVLLDIVFSFDSILTAVGLVEQIWVMVVAVVVSIAIILVLEGLNEHVSKGYIYFEIFFSLFVEIINLRVRARNEKRKAAITEMH